MDATIKADWTARLRSGEIPQGHGHLAIDSARCCLGVLCDIAVEAGILEYEDQPGITTCTSECTDDCPDRGTNVHRRYRAVGDTKADWEGGMLPRAAWEWAGLPDANPDVLFESTADGIEYHYATLASLNDGAETRNGHEWIRRHTFPEIANIIDANL